MPETSCLFASFDTTLSGAFDAHISRLVSHDTQPRKDLTLASATGRQVQVHSGGILPYDMDTSQRIYPPN